MLFKAFWTPKSQKAGIFWKEGERETNIFFADAYRGRKIFPKILGRCARLGHTHKRSKKATFVVFSGTHTKISENAAWDPKSILI